MATSKNKPTHRKSRGKSTKHSWLRHPMAVAIIPAVISVTLAAIFVFIQNRPASPAPSIEVDGMSIQAANYYPQAFKITFEIRNIGNQLAIITGARLRVWQFASLPICETQGDLPPTGSYQVNMPTSAKPGMVIDVPVSQQVGPDTADEFQVLLHTPPPKAQYEKDSETVSVYRVNVSLLYDKVVAPVDAGNLILSLPFDPSNQYVWTRAFQAKHGEQMEFMGNEIPQISRCMISNAKRLDMLLSLSGQRSSTLTALRSQMAYCCALGAPTVEVLRCTSDKPSVRPSSITIGCDGSGYLEDVKWSTWNFSSATGTGIFNVDDCQPNCAAGTFYAYPAKIILSNPDFTTTPGYSGWAWNSAVITVTAKQLPGGMSRTTMIENFAPTD